MWNWYALRTKPKKEQTVSVLLRQAGIEVYLPEIRSIREQRASLAVEPLFPGYVFGRLNPEQNDLRLVRYTRGMMYVVGFDGSPQAVPDEVIQGLQVRLANPRGFHVDHGFRAGDRLVVIDGPMRGLDAIFDRNQSAAGRVRVFLQIVQRMTPTDLHATQLRRAALERPA